MGTRRWLYHRSTQIFSLPQATSLSSVMHKSQLVASITTLCLAGVNIQARARGSRCACPPDVRGVSNEAAQYRSVSLPQSPPAVVKGECRNRTGTRP